MLRKIARHYWRDLRPFIFINHLYLWLICCDFFSYLSVGVRNTFFFYLRGFFDFPCRFFIQQGFLWIDLYILFTHINLLPFFFIEFWCLDLFVDQIRLFEALSIISLCYFFKFRGSCLHYFHFPLLWHVGGKVNTFKFFTSALRVYFAT